MKVSRTSSDAGFTYIAVLIMIVIMGIMMGAVGQSWRTVMKREREEELFFRAGQIRDAIISWNKQRPGQHVPTPLRDLKDLLKDPRSMAKVRFLRRLYTDPITGKDFEVIMGDASSQGIIGVKSTSQDPPLKRGNFPDDLKVFADKDKYSDWTFDYRLKATPPGTPPVIQ